MFGLKTVDKLLLFSIAVIVLYFIFLSKTCPEPNEKNQPLITRQLDNRPRKQHNLEEYRIKVLRKEITLKEATEKVFEPFGYVILWPTLPIPTLRYVNEPTCDAVFTKWLDIAKEEQPILPPSNVSDELLMKYTLNGYVGITYQYHDDKNSKTGEKPRNWDKLTEIMTWEPKRIAAMAYGTDGLSVNHAMSKYRLNGMNGFIVGSMQPWVEIFALRNGAKHILTVEYNKLEIEESFKNRMDSILPFDFASTWNNYADSFDFAATFSSIEHSGIGRYGDPIDPIGDFREMLKIKCLLKKGGLLFLGLPYGTDAIVFNLHRIYGSLRLAMMITGFELLDSFNGDTTEPFIMNSNTLHQQQLFGLRQYTLVLRKL